MNTAGAILVGVILTLLVVFGSGCGTNLTYQDTMTRGVPNFRQFGVAEQIAPGMYATGVPLTPEAQEALRRMVEVPGVPVTRVSLHDAAEADESWVYRFGWNLANVPLPPYGDKPLSVFEMPSKYDVMAAVYVIESAHRRGDIVVWGCVHNRERGNLITAILGMRMLGWSKEFAWQYMVTHGSRIEVTPGLLAFWDELTHEAKL